MNSTIKVLIFLGLILLTLQQSQQGIQCNVANCQYCSMPNFCGQCQNNYLLQLNSATGYYYCNQVTCPSNCGSCFQNNTCNSCNNNFILTNMGQCTTNSSSASSKSIPPNCLWGYSATNCSLCGYGFTLKSGYCYPTITLTASDANCTIKMSSSSCQICTTGYIVNQFGQCVSNNGYTGACNISNCIVCTNSTSCASCANGYQISGTTLLTCILLPCNLAGCQACTNSTACAVCQFGYLLNTVTNLCQMATSACSGIANCVSCLNQAKGQSCSLCSPGYQMIQQPVSQNYLCQPLQCPFTITNCNACVLSFDTIFNIDQALCGPNSCTTNYINVYGYCVQNVSTTQTVCNSQMVPNCASCSYTNFCGKCNPGYTLTTAGQCQITICNIQNCQSCSLNNVCQQCNAGFQLNSGYYETFSYQSLFINIAFALNIQCTPVNASIGCNIKNCQYCIANAQCFMCSPGTVLNTTNNQCSPTCNVQNCYICNTSTTVATARCKVCLPGYQISANNMQCNLINIACGATCANNSCIYNLNTNSGQCTSCMAGNILYNGTCYPSTCNIYGCQICAPWASPNSLCLQCSQSLVLSDGYCIVPNCDNKVANCVNCVQNGKCVGCQTGYFIQVVNASSNICVAQSSIKNCNVTNCMQCSTSNTSYCQQCATPYKAVNGQCVCGFQNCLDCSTSILTCNSCPTPLMAYLQDPNCLPQASQYNVCSVSNCQNCFDVNKCTLCSLGYTLNSNDFTCQMNNCSALGLANCLLCDQFGYACQSCNTGYMVDNLLQGGSCYPINANYTCNIAGCAVCSSTNNSICSMCLPAYYPNPNNTNGTVQCIPNSCTMSNCYLCLNNNTCTVCNTAYYLSLNFTCQPKYTNIVGCQGQILNCQTCVIGLSFSTKTPYCTKCKNGFQYNSAINQCIPQMNSIPNCKVQLPDYSSNNNPVCYACEQGYYINSWAQCSLYNPNITTVGCSVYNCFYCALNSTTCSFCFSPWGISNSGICTTNSTSVCANISNCQSCINATYCSVCVATYLPSSQGVCILCQVLGCNTCSTSNNCSSCQSGYQLTNGLCLSCSIPNCTTCSNNNICGQCATGLVPSSTGGSCLVCNIANCMSCLTNTKCGVCNSGYQLNQYTNTSALLPQCIVCNITNCLSCINNNICQSCIMGYNPATSGACQACNFPCQTCGSSNTTCATCQTPYYAYYPFSNGTCYVSTVPNCFTYSLNGTNIPTNCSSCSTGFTLNLTSNACMPNCNSNCLTCASNNGTSSSSCLTCYSGYYYNSTSKSCIQCQSTGCNNCMAGVSTCNSCMNGFYLIMNECKLCNGYCATCSSATVCTSLVTSTSQVLVTINQATFLAICPQGCTTCSSLNPQMCLSCSGGYYLSSTNSICMPCNAACMTCSSSNPNTCITCYPNNFLSGTPATCIVCNSNCATCNQATPNTCSSCYPGSYLSSNTSSNATCISGCSNNCITCSSSTMCTQCASGNTLYQQGTSTICVQCTSNCRTCASNVPYACLSCGTGFFLSNGQCMACTTNCASCLSLTSCTNCISGFFLTSSLTCSQNCIIPCATCSSLNPTKCSSCIAGYTFNSISFTCSPQFTCKGACTVCPIGSILQNGQCNQCNSTNCQVCNPTNLSQCYSCQPGYYINSNSQCVACLSSCSTCLRSNGCTTCASGYTSNSLVPMGANGYQCLKCSFPCATCENNIDYCTSCVSGYQFSGWKCTQIFNFLFVVQLLTTQLTFNTNYNNFMSALAGSIGSSNQNIVTINSITFGSVNVVGGVGPTAPSGTQDAFNQYNDLSSLLSQDIISGMLVGVSAVTVTGGTIDYSKVDLGLILGICIPVAVLLICGVLLYMYRKNKKTIIIQQNINDQSRYSNKESFQLSNSYKENQTNQDQTGRKF